MVVKTITVMTSVTLKDIANSVDRYKIYTLQCNPDELVDLIFNKSKFYMYDYESDKR